MFLRPLIAWTVGGFLYFFTLVTIDYDGFDTFVSGIVGGAITSTVCVAACLVTGFLLRVPLLARHWRSSLAPAGGALVLGLVLFAYGFFPGQLKALGEEEDGVVAKELGVTWLPGYLLLLFTATNWPKLSPTPEPGAA